MLNIEAALRSGIPSSARWPGPLVRAATALFRAITHETEINHFLDRQQQGGICFVENALDHLDVSWSINRKELENIPAIGKVIVVANHPLGAMDAFALIQLLAQVRQNGKVRVLANTMLMQVPQLKELLIPVDNISGAISRESVQQIEAALAREEAVLIFPAGEVSRFRPWGVRDGKWKRGFLKFARRSGAPVLPIHVDARNSALFYIASMLYKPFAAMLLPHEMLAARGRRLRITIGELVSERAVAGANLSLKQHARMFRKHLYLVGSGKPGIYATEKCIAHPENRQLLRAELKQAELIGETADGKSIYLADHAHSPKLLREIGRLREYTFRKVEEGTGAKRDRDRFDVDYRHIVLWDDAELEVVGAYRIGECRAILERHGEAGLYMHELCSFEPGFVDEVLPHAIELGRSFVQPRYWGSRALDYLWQGIGAYLRHHPEVRYMYGPVSLSHAYPRAARDAMVWFYLTHFEAGDVQGWMRARNPYCISDLTRAEMAARFTGGSYEADFRILRGYLKSLDVSVPTLFKQYSELCEPGGVRFFDFGLDSDFGDCVDGYLLVDIDRIRASRRQRYIGEAG